MSQKEKTVILVVDDNEISRLVTMETLLACGFSVDSAENAQEALKLFRSNSYDLIFMDQEMPEEDGFACMDMIRGYELESSASHPTPAVLLTANEDPSRSHDMSNFHTYLKKPLNHKQIQDVMQELNLTIPDDIIPDSEEGELSSEDSSWFHAFEQIPMIDGNAGLTHTGSLPLLKRVVDCFYQELDGEIAGFKEKLEARDTDSLRIRAHALKHSAYLIGALDLSVEAREAEELAKELKLPELQDFLPKLLQACEQLGIELETLIKNYKHQPSQGSLPEEDYEQALKDIHELIEAYDYEDGRLICDMLRDYALLPEQLDFIDNLYEALWRANQVELLGLFNNMK